jgi:Sigma-70, region 4
VDRHALPADLTSWDFADVFQNVVNLGVPVLGFVLASRRPENRMGWLFLAAGLALGLTAFAGPYGLHAVRVAPGSLPAGRAVAWLSNWVFLIQAAMLAFLLLLFPNGRLRSRRWRPAAWFVASVYTALGLALIVRATRFWAHPFRWHAAAAAIAPAPAEVDDGIVWQAEAKVVREAVAALPDRQREAVLLAYYRGRTYREVARDLGIPEDTARRPRAGRRHTDGRNPRRHRRAATARREARRRRRLGLPAMILHDLAPVLPKTGSGKL